MAERQLARINQFLERHPEFTHGQLRWLIFNAQRNGLAEAGAIVRLPTGRKGARNQPVYLDPERFFDWLDKQQQPLGVA